LYWQVDELTTSRIGPANVVFVAEDVDSGIDNSSSYIQYGFDSNGVGETPDLSGRWLTMGVNGLSGQVGLSSWATKSRQHLMFRAVLVDEAGNSFTTQASSFQILPGLDLYWNISETNVDRIVVRPGEQTGNITITSVLESNQDYGGSVIVPIGNRSSRSQFCGLMDHHGNPKPCLPVRFQIQVKPLFGNTPFLGLVSLTCGSLLISLMSSTSTTKGTTTTTSL
jgi:hypothetical protein